MSHDAARFRFATRAIRTGQERSQFGEHSEALYLTSSFVFADAAQAAALFAGEVEGYTYSRFTNPTVTLFQQRLAALEEAEDCIATASGMSAILTLVLSLLQTGDHIVAARGLFGATQTLFGTLLPKFGIQTTFVAGCAAEDFRAALKSNTRLVFIETPSNPLTEIHDIARLAEIAHAHGAWLAVDNCFCTPALQRPLTLGADVVVHSATKHLDGQGRVMGGALCASRQLTEEFFKFMRTAGPSLSPFNAWVLAKGLETLELRMRAHSANALELAKRLEAHPAIARVFYPGLPSHPQYALAQRQQAAGGAIVSFEVKGGREVAWRVIDHCQWLSVTSNLGDVKTTITHPATTTHGRLSPEARAAAGIGEGLLRVAVGLEDVDDIEADLLRGLGPR